MLQKLKRHSVILELLAFVSSFVVLIYLLRSALFTGETTFGHDNMLWHYPIFQFYVENILRGNFVTWNPLSHSGEAFYVLLGQIRLLDPITFVVVALGQVFTRDVAILFGWDRIVRSLVFAIGVYLVYRPLARHLLTKVSMIPILLFSSLMLASLRQDAFLDQAIFVPYVTYFFLRIIYYRDYDWRNWLALATFIGISWQSYMFTGTWIFLLFMVIGLAIFRRDLLVAPFRNRRVIFKLGLFIIVLLAMASPYISLFPIQGDNVYPPRMIDFDYSAELPRGGPIQFESGPGGETHGGIRMPYDYLSHTGTFSTIWDFIQVIAIDGNSKALGPYASAWGEPSEAFTYVGLLAWAIIILGLVGGRHDLRRVWLVIFAGFFLLMLGPAGGLHRLLYFVYPPLWFVRHTHGLVIIFGFILMYFYVLGCERLIDLWAQSNKEPRGRAGIFGRLVRDADIGTIIATTIFCAVFIISVNWMTNLEYPATYLMSLLIALVFVTAFILRRDLGVTGLFCGLIIGYIVVVLMLTRNMEVFLFTTAVFLIIPGVLFSLPIISRSLPRSYLVCLPVLLIGFVTADLLLNFVNCSFLYNWPTPSAALGVKTTAQNVVFPSHRLAYPPYPNTSPYIQQVRYLDLIYRQTYALSGIVREQPLGDDPGTRLPVLKNGSFESWVVATDGSNLPEFWEYYQDGSGGEVRQYTAPDGVKDGKTSAFITPSSEGNSFLRFRVNDMASVRGHYVWFTAWVKSANRTPEAIQMDMQDGVANIAVETYFKSGEWIRMTVGRYVSPLAPYLFVTLNVKASATAGVYIDSGMMSYEAETDYTPESLGYGLGRKRWSSFFLPRNYFNLIHSGIDPAVLEEMFAVLKPTLQFKSGFLELHDKELPVYLGQMSKDDALQLLDQVVFLPGPVGPEMVNLRRSSGMYTQSVKSAASASGAGLVGTLDYTLQSYDYNSMTMRVQAPTEGILYWSDGYDKLWQAFVNGEKVPVYRANINFKAIHLPQGESVVSFRYEPVMFIWGLYLFYGAFFICLFVLARKATEGLRK